jgi:hypothetical protein
MRTREVKHGRNGDNHEGCAGNMRETRGCPNDKPTDCLLSLWTDWAECDRMNDTMTIVRSHHCHCVDCITAMSWIPFGDHP